MSDILVSIIESVADAAAAARARRGEVVAKAPPAPAYLVQRFTQDEPRPQAPAPVSAAIPEPVVTPRPVAAEAAPAARHIALRRLFADPQSLIRTVVAAEILGPPVALRRQNLWDSPSV